DTSKVVAEFFGDESFPVEWESEQEKKLFWVYDDLHCPRPVSPMYDDIANWVNTCDHMFRRFGTPFASDWIKKVVNGYLYTAAVPCDPDMAVPATEFGNVYFPRVPKDDPEYASKIGAYLGAVLPTYGANFPDWWKDRLVPEMAANLAYLEEKIDDYENISLMDWAVILEDAIDIVDRHWKIHWMLNFSQLSSTLALRGALGAALGGEDKITQTHEQILGRLQNSSADRNWDAIEVLVGLKDEIKADDDLMAAFANEKGADILAALESTESGREFVAGGLKAYQREFGWHAVWSHEFIYPSRFETPEPVLDMLKGYLDSDYDHRPIVAHLEVDIKAAAEELIEGIEEGDELEALKAANEINLLMAPLTPDHHFYIDQGTHQHTRVVLICIGRKLVEMGLLDEPDDVIYLKYNELRYLMGDPSLLDARAIVAERRATRAEHEKIRPPDFIGTATEDQLQFPYLNLWGFPEKLNFDTETKGRIEGLGVSPGVIQGIAKVVSSPAEFDEVQPGDILVCQMTNPAWTTLFAIIGGIVCDAGGMVAHPAVMAREFGIPGVTGTGVATREIKTGDRLRVDGTNGVVEIL
ncbi:MAG: PEP-utilizing enzyme, partial [Acidimicrobiia bacterium]|nr:PEP-utilizing enzyme [Acidimicrobiia bacterium]